MGLVRIRKKILIYLLVLSILLGGLPVGITEAADTTDLIVPIFTASQKFSSEVTKTNVVVNLSSKVPSGYKIKSYVVWKATANSSGGYSLTNQGTYGSTRSTNVITFGSFNGAPVNVKSTGFTSHMYFDLHRNNNAKEYRFSLDGKLYEVKPDASSDCWESYEAVCAGLLNKDTSGVTIPSTVRNANGWALATSDGFVGPSSYKFNSEVVSFSNLIANSVKIDSAAVTNGSPIFVKPEKFGAGSGNRGYLSIAIKMTKGNTLGELIDSNMSYDLETTTNWSAKTNVYEGEIRAVLEKLPEPTTPVVTCDCEVNPDNVTFTNQDVLVDSKLTATLTQSGGKTVKNWTLYGKAKDGTQLVTLTSMYAGSSSINHTFNFKILASKLASVDSYTETWVMRARVYFTDGTTAEEFIECTTTVTKSGATPAPSPTATPEPTPEPLEAKARFQPAQIIAGEQASLLNYSTGLDSFYWEFSENLGVKLPNTSTFEYHNVTYGEPGIYTATINVSNGSQTKKHTVALNVIDPKPVAVVSGVTKVTEGRPFPYAYHLNNSYTPLADKGITIDHTKSEKRYKKVGDVSYIAGFPVDNTLSAGEYVLEGKVYDSNGKFSDWGTLQIEVIPDQPPTVSVISPEESYRSNAVTVFIDANSPEGDTLSHLLLEERYDKDNDGNFIEEAWSALYDGAYKNTHSVTYSTVGKRQYRAKVTEEYGKYGESNISTTDIINYAPTVDFKAVGLTQQPDQGADSAPPLTKFTADSIFRSWTAKIPFKGGTGSKLGWKSDSTNISTKNAIMSNFDVGYPNSGNGANSRTKYQLAADIVGKPTWINSGNLVTKIFAGHRIYSYVQDTNLPNYPFIISEKNAITGEVLRTFKIEPPNNRYTFLNIGPDETFYFADYTDLSTNPYEVKIVRYDNTGTYKDTIVFNSSKTTSSGAGLGVGVKFLEISPDGEFMYVGKLNSYNVPADAWSGYYMTEVRFFKYSLKNNTLVWEAGSEEIERGYLSNFNMTLASNGDTYFTWNYEFRYSTGLQSYRGNVVLVKPDGTSAFGQGGGVGISPVSVSDDNGMAYWTSANLSDSDKYANMIIFGFRNITRTDGSLYFNREFIASIVTSRDDWGHNYYEVAPQSNPIVFPDTRIYAQGRLHTSYNLFYSKYGNQIGSWVQASQSANTGKMFIASNEDVIYPVVSTVARTSYNYSDPKVVRASLYNLTKNTYLANTPYTGPSPQSWEVPYGKSTPILPDGSIYVFHENYVMPFVPANTSGSIKEIDANTIEITNDEWGGLLYDAGSSLKNYVFEFSTSVNDPKNAKVIGAGFQIQDEKNMYTLEWDKTTLSIYKVVNGAKTLLQSIPFNRTPFTTYPIKIESVNGIHRVYVNYAKVLEVADGTYGKGYVGLLSLGQPNVVFSNVSKTNYGDFYTEETLDTVLINEAIRYDKVFKDIENDPSSTELWTYKHDPNFYLNSQGLSAYDGKSYGSPIVTLDKVGIYEVSFKSADNPTFPTYSKWSEPTTRMVYAHRRPVAVPDVRFTGSVSSLGILLDYDTYDSSYDLDTTDGLVERKFRTRWADESIWTDGKRDNYGRPGVELIIQEQVKDINGAWSQWAQIVLYRDALPPINQTKPSMVITTPAGTLASPTTYINDPTVWWTYSDAENDPQEKYKLTYTYVDNNQVVLSEEYEGDEKSFPTELGTFAIGRKVKVQGSVYSKGLWSDASNSVYFVINTPPTTILTSYNGTVAAPVYTNNNKPTLNVTVTDPESHSITAVDYEVYFSSNNDLVADTNASTSAKSRTLASPLAEGLHYWKARSFDGYQWGPYSSNGFFFVDTVKPEDVNEILDIEPTSVTVNFNAFSDPDPSSGHSTRTFYLQKVNANGSVTNVDLNGDGTTEYSVPIALTRQSYKVTGLTPGQEYRLTVLDYDVAGNEGHYAYIHFFTNRPPTGNFDWSPKPVYEGDTVNFKTNVDDADGNLLVITYEITSPSGSNNIYSYNMNTPYPDTGPSIRMNTVGNWSVKLTVSDGIAEPVTVTKTIQVLPLGITGSVTHTTKWEENRVAYNTANPTKTRSVDTFWAGEEFILAANVTNTGASLVKADRVTVGLVGQGVTVDLSNTPLGSINWRGSMWRNNFDDLPDGNYNFLFTVYYSNDVVKTATETVRIKDSIWDVTKTHQIH